MIIRKCYLILTLLLGSSFMVVQAEEWFPYIESEGRVATDRSVVRGNIFAPVWQDEDSFFFFDIRGLTTNEDANEGNLGFGYRKLVGPDRLFGFYGYYDFRETEFGNQYHQGSLGAEMLASKWGLRVNGYLPEDNIDVVSSFNTAFLSGNNVFVRQGLEAAYRGADIELERLLWSNTGNGKGGKVPLKVAEFDAEWWASVGYFHFDQGDSRFENISGPRLRTELRLWNIPMFGNDSRIMLTGQYDYDDVRGSIGTGGLSVRIPLGRAKSDAAPLSGIRRRMLENVVRDIDIVTNAGAFGNPERAKFARTGTLINGTVSVDGNTADPEAVIEGAGDNSLVLADGSAGTILPAGTIDMNTGQVILGGGSVIGVVGCDTGAHANFWAPGTRPTFRSGMNAGFTGATNGAIIGVNFGSTVDGSNALILNDVTNFLLDDVFVSSVGLTSSGGGDAIRSTNSSFELLNSTISTVGTLADGIDSNNSTYLIRNSTIDVGDDGIDASRDNVTIIDSTVISRDDNIDSDDSVFAISGSTFITNAFRTSHSLIDDRGSRFVIDDSTFVMNGILTTDVIGLRESDFVMTNSTVTINNGAALGFEIFDINSFTLQDSTITINDNANDTTGFSFEQSVDSTITIRNTILDNNNTGFFSDGLNIVTSGTATVALNIEDSMFTTFRGKVIDDITSNDTSNLTVNILNSTLKGENVGADAIEDFTSNNGSTMNVNIIGSTIMAARTDAIEDFESNDTSTMNVVIRDSTITGNSDLFLASEGNAVDGFQSRDNSNMTVLIENSNLTGNGASGDAIDDITTFDTSRMTVTLRESNFVVGAVEAGDSGEGIEDFRARGSSMLTASISGSTIVGNGTGDGISDLDAGISSTDSGTLRATIVNTTIKAGTGGKAIRSIGAVGTANSIVSIRNSALTGNNDNAVRVISENNGTLSAEFKNNTLTSGAAFTDFDFEQLNTSTLDVVDLPTLSTDNNGATIMTSGTIGDIPALP